MAQIGVLGQAILSNPHTPLGTNYHENRYFLIKNDLRFRRGH
jgi:hypothetical protein